VRLTMFSVLSEVWTLGATLSIIDYTFEHDFSLLLLLVFLVFLVYH
jgi:hypothetical protein